MCLEVWLVLGDQVHQRRHFGCHLDGDCDEGCSECDVSGVLDERLGVLKAVNGHKQIWASNVGRSYIRNRLDLRKSLHCWSLDTDAASQDN